MKRAFEILRNVVMEENGQDLVEYALVAVLLSLSAVVTMKTLANSIGNTFNSVGTTMTNAL